jgi:antitoxin component HigA of HigAB toxin-antitoxin module
MTTAVRNITVPASYLKLVRLFPLRPLANHGEYEAAVRVMEKLAVRGEDDLDAGERDYLDALDEFIAAFDRKHFSLGQDKRTPLQRLKYILAESGTSPAGMRKILGCSQPLVSMILSGERELSKDNIRALSAHFKVDAGLLL